MGMNRNIKWRDKTKKIIRLFITNRHSSTEIRNQGFEIEPLVAIYLSLILKVFIQR